MIFSCALGSTCFSSGWCKSPGVILFSQRLGTRRGKSLWGPSMSCQAVLGRLSWVAKVSGCTVMSFKSVDQGGEDMRDYH